MDESKRLIEINALPVYNNPNDNTIFANARGHSKLEKLDPATISHTAQEGLWYWHQEFPDEFYEKNGYLNTYCTITGFWETPKWTGEPEMITCKCNACMMAYYLNDFSEELFSYKTFAPQNHCKSCMCYQCVCPARRVCKQFAERQQIAHWDNVCRKQCPNCFLTDFNNRKLEITERSVTHIHTDVQHMRHNKKSDPRRQSLERHW